MSAHKKSEEELAVESSKIQSAVDDVLGSDNGESAQMEQQDRTSLTLVEGDMDLSQFNSSNDASDEGGIELSIDDEIDISLCAEDDEVENAPADASSPTDMDLDLSGSLTIDLTGEGDDIPNAPADAARSDDLDLDNNPIIVKAKTEVEAEVEEEVVEALADDESFDDLGDIDELGDLGELDDFELTAELDDELGDLDVELGNLDDDFDDFGDDLGELEEIEASAALDVDESLDEELSLGEEVSAEIEEPLEEDTLAQLDDMINENVEAQPEAEEEETMTAVSSAQEEPLIRSEQTASLSMGSIEQEISTNVHDSNIHEPAAYKQQSVAASGVTIHPGHILSSMSEEQLLDLRVSVNELKADRTNLLNEINELSSMVEILKRENLNLRSETDDKAIELTIAKKRHAFEIEETKSQLDNYKHGLELSEAKNKAMKEEMAEVGRRMNLDHSSIRAREQELESQLELMAIDSDNKIKARDEKILELKRKIDTLEFNMENMAINEKQAKKERMLAQQKLERLINNLRGSLNIVSDTIELDLSDIEMEN